jgi:hypothetical protein
MIRRRCGWLALILGCFVLAVAPASTLAICVRLSGDNPVPADAQLVFVGTVADTAANEQNALIHIEEIWRGGPLPEWLPVIGTQDPSVIWEDTTRFNGESRYLVVADRYEGAIVPRGCGYTTPYSADLAALRPLNPSMPVAVARPIGWEPRSGQWLWLPLIAAAVTIGTILVVNRLRRRPNRPN